MSEVLGEKAWAKEMIEYYSNGYSDAEVAAAMKVTLRQFRSTVSENATFAKLVEYGHTLSTAFWEGLARKNVNNKAFNSSLYGFYMKNKYGWADKVETTNANENTNIGADELQQQILNKISALVKNGTPELADAQRVLQAIAVKEDDE